MFYFEKSDSKKYKAFEFDNHLLPSISILVGYCCPTVYIAVSNILQFILLYQLLRRIQALLKHLRWSFMQRLLTAESLPIN